MVAMSDRSGVSVGVTADPESRPRDPVRAPRVVVADVVSAESVCEDPAAPPEPCRSAWANGVHTTAAPTPNANAKAPILPTQRAYPDGAENWLAFANCGLSDGSMREPFAIGNQSPRPSRPRREPTSETVGRRPGHPAADRNAREA